MAVGMSPYLANLVFNAIGNATPFSIATPYIKLHLDDPGAAGTASPAGNTTRKLISFAVAASGLMTNDADVIWTAVAGTEDYSHYSVFDASSGGNFLWSGLLDAAAVATGTNFLIPAGAIDLAITLAA